VTFNKRVDRLESGPNNPKSPNDEVIWVDTENNSIKRYNETNSSWVSVGGSGATSGDIVSPTTIKDSNDVEFGSIEVYESMGQEVVRIEASDSLFLIANEMSGQALLGGYNISVNAGNNLIINGTNHIRMVSQGGQYIGDTIANNQIAPIGDILSASSGSLFSGDIQVDGQINLLTPASAAYITGYYDSMFGGNVLSIRSDYNVSIVGQSESEAGILNLAPLQASLIATGEDAVAEIRSYGVVKLSGEDGVYVGEHPLTPDKEVATIGDLPSGATGSFTSQDNKTITVTNGIITSIV
jgi:hypothetical protein